MDSSYPGSKVAIFDSNEQVTPLGATSGTPEGSSVTVTAKNDSNGELLAKARAARRGPRKTPVEKLASKKRSMTLAIAAKCWDCQGGDADPAPRWRIGNCECTGCPLWNVRPHRNLQGKPLPTSLR